MTSFMEKVLSLKQEEIKKKKNSLSYADLYASVKDLGPTNSLFQCLKNKKGIITEIKKASPSRGIFYNQDRIDELSRSYEKNGASAISLVTEKNYFLGELKDLVRVRKNVSLPILRKDFIVDEYQVLESRYFGADAVLLIASLLSLDRLSILLDLVHKIGMEALVEVHTQQELRSAFDAGAHIVGINNRNLKTLNVNLNRSRDLLSLIPKEVIKVVESGIRTGADLLKYKGFQVDAFLIGEALVISPDPGERLRQFLKVLKES